MDEQTKKQQRDEPIRACADVLKQAMKDAGFKEYMILGARREGESSDFDVFAMMDCSTMSMANIFLFMFNQMNDEAIAKLMNWLLSQPQVIGPMVALQAKVMAETAENLKAQAAASPEPTQPAPMVPDSKNKSWLN